MSSPASICLRTISSTADRTRAASAAGSTGTPSSRANIIWIRSAGRGRLPVCVVRNRSLLRFMRNADRASVGLHARDREHEVQRAAELVQPARAPAHEGVTLLVGQVGAAQRGGGIAPEALAERAVLLETVEQHVDVVAAHVTAHSSAARSILPISPKKRTRARAGVTAPSSTIQLSSSCEPVACSSLAVSAVRLACSARSIQPTTRRSNSTSEAPTRASDSSGKGQSPPGAITATFQGPAATARAMSWPAAKQRRAGGSGATKQVTQKGTGGGIGRGPEGAQRVGPPRRELAPHLAHDGDEVLHHALAVRPHVLLVVGRVEHVRHRRRVDDATHDR